MKLNLIKVLMSLALMSTFSAQAHAFCMVMGSGLCAASCQGNIDGITADAVKEASDDEKVCALSFADGPDVLAVLIKRGVDVNVRTKHPYTGEPSGNTAYFEIESHDRLDLLNYLLQNGFNVNTQDAHGMSPLMYAAWDNKREMVEALLKAGANPNLKDRFGYTALCFVQTNLPFMRDEEIISMLKKSGGGCDI